MAEDAYKLKRLDDIMDYDPELQLGKNPVYNTEQGVIYKDGKIYTTDYNEDQSKIIVRDVEGTIVDVQYSESGGQETSRKTIRNIPRFQIMPKCFINRLKHYLTYSKNTLTKLQFKSLMKDVFLKPNDY